MAILNSDQWEPFIQDGYIAAHGLVPADVVQDTRDHSLLLRHGTQATTIGALWDKIGPTSATRLRLPRSIFGAYDVGCARRAASGSA